MIGHDSLPDGLNKPENHDRIEAELCASIDIAVERGIGALICFSGNVVEGMEEEEAIDHHIWTVTRADLRSRRRLLLEPG